MKTGVNSRIFLEKGSGVPNYVAHLYRKCQEIDRANEYVFFQPNVSRTLGSTLVASTPSGPLGAAWFDCLRVERLIRRSGVNLFHGPAHTLPLRKTPGVRYVVTIHDLAIRLMPEQYDPKLRWYYRWQLPRSAGIADAILAVSHNTKRDLMRLYAVPEEKIRVVHLGVGPQFLKLGDAPAERVVAQRYLLSITTHPRRKNLPGALRAFAMLAGRQELRFVIAGIISGSQQRELSALAEELGISGRVQFFGYASDDQLISLYQNAEFLVYPSFYEGFGFPVLEAMACGCPVIASNTSSLPEIVPDAEWLVDPNQPEAIADAMRRILALPRDRRRALVAENQKHARSFTWERTASRTIELFHEISGNQPRRSASSN